MKEPTEQKPMRKAKVAYVRSFDGAEMVEIAPFLYVNAKHINILASAPK